MFHEHHHKSIFPLAVAGMTLALLLVLGLLYGPMIKEQGWSLAPSSPMAMQTAYERNTARIVAVLDERLALTETDEARADVIMVASSDLLTLVVPASHQGLHLQMVTTLDQLRQGYVESDAVRVASALQRWSEVRDQYSWLSF